MTVIKFARIGWADRWLTMRPSTTRGVPAGRPTCALSSALEEFGSEDRDAPVASPPIAGEAVRRWRSWGFWLLLVCAGATVGIGGIRLYQHARSAAEAPGQVTIESSPSGVEVTAAGVLVGKTPMTLSLPVGVHELSVGTGAQRRDLRVTVTAGSSILQHLELASPVPAPVATTGSLQIQTEPTRLPVRVGNQDRGLSPVTLKGLAPGQHQVSVRGPSGVVRRSVTVEAGATASLVVSSMGRAAPAPGWIKVVSPVTLQIREEGRVIGTSDSDQVVLTAGEHTLELFSEALGYRATRTVSVVPGQATTVAADLPSGTLSINALPWAEVWIDGQRAGQTPLANLSTRIGPHEIVLRHPEHGEQRISVVVTLREPARVGVSMRKEQP